jgi:hypothetical protein
LSIYIRRIYFSQRRHDDAESISREPAGRLGGRDVSS